MKMKRADLVFHLISQRMFDKIPIVEHRLSREVVSSFVESSYLTDRDRDFLLKRIQGQTIQSIAENSSVTPARVQQIIDKSILRTRQFITSTRALINDDGIAEALHAVSERPRQSD